MRVLTAESMQALDRRAIEEIGVPVPVLMENAALGVVESVLREFPRVSRPLVVCGPGNNGGDGLAVARQLAARGCAPHVAVISQGNLSADTELQLEIARRLGLSVEECAPGEARPRLADWLQEADLVIDGLFGTGLSRPLREDWGELVEALCGLAPPVVAIDLPSGLDASSHRIPGAHVRATMSVTFVAPKVAHVLPPAALECGEIVIADLGLPELWGEEPPEYELLEAEALREFLPPRSLESHKGSFGHLLVWAGARGTSGAAILAAQAAGRAGSGLITVAAPEDVLPIVESGSVESMTLGLRAEDADGLAGELRSAESRATAMAIGPGLGTDEMRQEAVRTVVAESPLPMVLDADALAAYAGSLEELRERGSATVLTPHPGELARLLETSTEAIQEDRVEAARQAAARSRCTVLLKGYRTLIATPDHPTAIVPVGGPELASGGTGDVLTGFLGGLLAGGAPPRAAACVAAYAHGCAGERVAAAGSERSLLAGDLLAALPAAFAELEEA